MYLRDQKSQGAGDRWNVSSGRQVCDVRTAGRLETRAAGRHLSEGRQLKNGCVDPGRKKQRWIAVGAVGGVTE